MYLLFYHIYCWVQRHKLVAVLAAIGFLFAFGILGAKLRFEEDITHVIPKSQKSDMTTKVMRQMSFSDKITAIITLGEKGSLDDAASFAQSFVDTLEQDSSYIRTISGQIDPEAIGITYDFVYQNIPLFLEPEDYDTLARKITPRAIAAKVQGNYQSLISPSSFVITPFIEKDPLGIGVLGLKKLQQTGLGDNFSLHEGFLITKDSSQLLLFLSPRYEGGEAAENKRLADYLYGIQHDLNIAYKEKAKISYFGAALVASANADQIKTDIFNTVVISMSVLMVLLILFYRKIYIPFLVFIPTVFAAVFALGCLFLYKPVISAISLSIGAVLIGVTIDYALHILTHFKKNSDVKELYKELTKPLIMSGATNAVAFLCLLFVHSEALIDLGIFASIALVSSAVFTLLIVPHLYHPKKQLKHNSLLDRLAAFPFERSKILIGICLLTIGVSLFTSDRVHFNNDLSKLNYMPDFLREAEHKLDKLTNNSAKSLYVVATGKTLETALQLNEQVAEILDQAQDQGKIIAYSNVNRLINSPAKQQAKIGTWNAFWSYHNKDAVKKSLQNEGRKYGFQNDAHEVFYELLSKDFDVIEPEDFDVLPNIGLQDYIAKRDSFYTVSSLVKLQDSNRNVMIGVLEKQQGVVVIDRKQLNETFLGRLRDDFNQLIGYSSFAVLLILWLFFRRIEFVLLAAIPIALTGLVTAGLMGLFGLEFNIFSAIVCTLVFGHGVDFSIFMTAALQKQYTSGEDELQVYRTSILLAVLTTVLAIGALIFAKHPALISISSVSLLGVCAAVVITFVFYPLIFRFFISDRAKRGKAPITVGILFWSLVFFTYYGVGCIVLSIIARFILPVFPFRKESKDRIVRKVVSRFMKSVLYGHPLISNQVRNISQETFEKPAIVIGNHSSFLDTLTMGMLVPKMIFLVNDWVWNSPIFGRAVRSLGFFPVSEGLADNLEVLREKVQQGYSLVIFPEGTRSYDNTIKRFHKGAFYLSEQLELDIVPVYIHGNGDVLPKGDILIFPGKLSPVIGDRIQFRDTTFGVGYGERAKKVSMFFKEQYEIWRLQLEDVDYFLHKIKLAYLYKDDEVVLRVKRSLQRWKIAFYQVNRILGSEELKITHWGDDFGELDYLLSLQHGKRKVIGVLPDEKHVDIARSIYWSQIRQVKFDTKLVGSGVLVISGTISEATWTMEELLAFEKIIQLNVANNLDKLLGEMYDRQTFEHDILVYIRKHG